MRRCRTGLLACSIATSAWSQGEPQPTPVAQAAAQAATAVEPAASAAGLAESAGPGVRWQIPLALSGALSYDLRLDHSESERRRTRQLITATLNAASYIYQPWLAVVNGHLGLTQGRSDGGDAPGPDHDRFVTGNLRLGVFPRSRFPLEARVEVSDSRIDPALGGSVDYRARTFALSQRYRPATGEFALAASYERRSQDGAAIGEDTQQALLGDFNSRWRRHQFSAALARSVNRRRSTDEQTDFRNAVLRHSWGSGSELSIETSANWAQTDDRLATGRHDLRLAQWSSVGLWRPADQPLTLSASVRGFSLRGADLEGTETLNVALGATYEASPKLRLNGNASLARTQGLGAETWLASLGATYQGDSREFGPYRHDAFGGLSLSHARGPGGVDSSASGQAGHTLSRSWGPTDGVNWSLTLSQTANVSHATGSVAAGGGSGLGGISRALSHTAGLSWNSVGTDRSAFARLSLSDARQFDDERSHFQIINFQLSGSHEISRHAGWSGDVTLQRVFQRSRASDSSPVPPASPDDPFAFDRQITQTASGELSYRHARVFDVPRLRFTSRLRLSHDAQTQRNVLLAQPERETASWDNRLDWQVGRLETTLSLRIGRTDGVWRELLMLRLQRSFGD